MPNVIAAFLAVLVVLAVALFWQPSDFSIRVHGGRVSCKGQLPRVLHQALADFILQEFPGRRTFLIKGSRHSGRLRLWFRGRLSPGEKQRLRNFLTSAC
jgi:hypothetical protein